MDLQDVGKLRVAEVGDNLRLRLGHSCGQTERFHCPVQVALPALLLQRQALTKRRLIDLQLISAKVISQPEA